MIEQVLIKSIFLLLLLLLYLLLIKLPKSRRKRRKTTKNLYFSKLISKVPLFIGTIDEIAKVKRVSIGYSKEEAYKEAVLTLRDLSIISLLHFMFAFIVTSTIIPSLCFACLRFRSMLSKELIFDESFEDVREGLEKIIAIYGIAEHKNILSTLKEVVRRSESPMVEFQFEELVEILSLSEEEGQIRLNDFKEASVNPHMNLAAKFIFRTHHDGDVIVDDQSLFIKKIEEILKPLSKAEKRRLSYMNGLKSWESAILTPLLLLDLSRWGAQYLSDILHSTSGFSQAFYGSPLARVFYYGIIVFIAVFHSIVLDIISSDYMGHKTADASSLSDFILRNKTIRKAIESKIPRKGSQSWQYTKSLMVESGKIYDMRFFYLLKFTFLGLAVVVAFGALVSARFSSVNDIVYDPLYGLTITEVGSNYTITKEWIKEEEIDKFGDYDVKSIRKGGLGDEHEEKIASFINHHYPDGYLSKEFVFKRVLEKRRALKKQIYFVFFDLLIFAIAAFAGFYAPETYLSIKGALGAKGRAEEEAILLIGVTLILRYQRGHRLVDLISWLKEFSNVFLIPFENAEKELRKSVKTEEEIVNDLVEEIDCAQFNTLGEGLKLVADGGSVSDVFATLSHSKDHYNELHEEKMYYVTKERIKAITDMRDSMLTFSLSVYMFFPMMGDIIFMAKQAYESAKGLY